MRILIRIALFLFAVWVANHPNTKALIIGVSSSFIQAPIEKAKIDFRKEGEKQAQKQAEARMKKIDASIDAANPGANK